MDRTAIGMIWLVFLFSSFEVETEGSGHDR